MPPEPRCKATTSDGTPCGAPSGLVDPETGFCPAHDPAKREAHLRRSKRGGEATAKKHAGSGVRPHETFPLRTFQDAERWLDLILRTVITGKITHQQARAGVDAIRAWMEAHDNGQIAGRLEAIEAGLAEWKRTGDPAPVLKLVKA